MVVNFGREFRKLFLISNFRRVVNVVFSFVGDSPVPEFYVPIFPNTLFPLSLLHTTYEDGTGRVFRNVGT
jgi:hypothetical protein